ncbi:hypothetical protein PCASD_24687 [Puccinia coronata f. sp. avenae]|uniref:F-box domain-containing protein n=1 Tax=Puccinia coronata f. sp. avenae TaxID=200324 RepID=A0A2N5TKW4_9BASI|nr:hypothetical protein PCASD_24687 [Puccinia coronata f. sp. avenae]
MTLAAISPRGAQFFHETFVGRSLRSQQAIRAKNLMHLEDGLSRKNFEKISATLKSLNYVGPLAAGSDQTVCLKTLRVHNDCIVGAQVALLASQEKEKAADIVETHRQFLAIANESGINILSLSANGAANELLAQTALSDLSDKHITFVQPKYEINIRIPLLGNLPRPLVAVQDPKHARKTCANQILSGARLLSFGKYWFSILHLAVILKSDGTSLYTKDVYNCDKQDDGRAYRLFNEETMKISLEKEDWYRYSFSEASHLDPKLVSRLSLFLDNQEIDEILQMAQKRANALIAFTGMQKIAGNKSKKSPDAVVSGENDGVSISITKLYYYKSTRRILSDEPDNINEAIAEAASLAGECHSLEHNILEQADEHDALNETIHTNSRMSIQNLLNPRINTSDDVVTMPPPKTNSVNSLNSLELTTSNKQLNRKSMTLIRHHHDSEILLYHGNERKQRRNQNETSSAQEETGEEPKKLDPRTCSKIVSLCVHDANAKQDPAGRMHRWNIPLQLDLRNLTSNSSVGVDFTAHALFTTGESMFIGKILAIFTYKNGRHDYTRASDTRAKLSYLHVQLFYYDPKSPASLRYKTEAPDRHIFALIKTHDLIFLFRRTQGMNITQPDLTEACVSPIGALISNMLMYPLSKHGFSQKNQIVAQYQGLIKKTSNILDLPREILELIFSHLVTTPTKWGHPLHRASFEAYTAAHLRLVCRAWADWLYEHHLYRTLTFDSASQSLAFIDYLGRRSRKLPRAHFQYLEVDFIWAYHHPPQSPQRDMINPDILETLLELFSDTIVTLDLKFVDFFTLPTQTIKAIGRLTNLYNLHLNLSRWPSVLERVFENVWRMKKLPRGENFIGMKQNYI